MKIYLLEYLRERKGKKKRKEVSILLHIVKTEDISYKWLIIVNNWLLIVNSSHVWNAIENTPVFAFVIDIHESFMLVVYIYRFKQTIVSTVMLGSHCWSDYLDCPNLSKTSLQKQTKFWHLNTLIPRKL